MPITTIQEDEDEIVVSFGDDDARALRAISSATGLKEIPTVLKFALLRQNLFKNATARKKWWQSTVINDGVSLRLIGAFLMFSPTLVAILRLLGAETTNDDIGTALGAINGLSGLTLFLVGQVMARR